MRLVLHSALVLAVLVVAAACGEKLVLRTQLMAIVSADGDMRPKIKRLHVRVSGRSADEDDWRSPSLDAEYTQLEWPFRVGIVPDAGDVRRRVLVEVIAISETGEELIALRAVTGYLPGRTLALPLVFESSCLHRSCGDETCRAGECVSAEVDPNGLLDFDGLDADLDKANGFDSDAGDGAVTSPALDGSTAIGDGDVDGNFDASASELGDAGPVGHLPAYSLCGKPEAEASPGDECAAIVTCGYAGRCDVTQNICCTSSLGEFGGECGATACGLNARTYCDGPEDCAAGTVCCFAGGGAACAPRCDLNSEMCHVTADCTKGECLAGSPGGAIFWAYWGICR